MDGFQVQTETVEKQQVRTYPTKMRAERLTAQNSYLFVQQLEKLQRESRDKNRDWWGQLITEWDTMFDAWYVVFDGEDNLIAFSSVQAFDNGWWRLMTRMWNGVRKQGLARGLIQDELTPAMLMLHMQLEEFGHEKCFISMEYINRRKFMKQLAEKINKMFGLHWFLNDGMQLTCDDHESFSCWQNTISNEPIDRLTISVEQYLAYFENERKKVK